MTTGGHNLQRSFALLLADNIEQIFVAFIPSRRLGERRRKRCLPRKKCANLLQMVGDLLGDNYPVRIATITLACL